MSFLFALFGGLSGTAKLITIGVMLLSLVTAGGVIYAKIEHSGYNRAIREIAGWNTEPGSIAEMAPRGGS